MTELDACQFIAEENPICAPCAPNPIPPPAPTPYSTKLDVASYSDTPAPGGRVDVAGARDGGRRRRGRERASWRRCGRKAPSLRRHTDVERCKRKWLHSALAKVAIGHLRPYRLPGVGHTADLEQRGARRHGSTRFGDDGDLTQVPRMNDWGFVGSTPGGPSAGVSLAWDNLRFHEVPGGSGFTYITTGPYAARYVGYARLVDRESGSTIFFANTHGPHIGCPTWLGESWLSVVTDNIVSGDLMAGTRIEILVVAEIAAPGASIDAFASSLAGLYGRLELRFGWGRLGGHRTGVRPSGRVHG